VSQDVEKKTQETNTGKHNENNYHHSRKVDSKVGENDGIKDDITNQAR
jgi:hypothetical protein